MKRNRPYRQVPARRCAEIAITCGVIAAVLGLLIVMGCAPKHVRPVCRHKAVFCAMTWSDLEYVPVRIAVGPSTIPEGRSHAQAQARVGGEWRWLVVYDDVIALGDRDWWFEPERYCTVAEAMTWIDVIDGTRIDADERR